MAWQWWLVVFAGSILVLAFGGWLGSTVRPARILGRLAPPTPPGELDARVGEPVVLEGELTAPAATFFPQRIASIEDADMRARPHGTPAATAVRVGGLEVALDGPVQVVLGQSERRHELGVVRALRAGDRVFVEGVVRRVAAREADKTYRDRAHAFELAGRPEEGWSQPPIVLYAAVRPRRVVPTIGLALSFGLAGLGTWRAVRAGVDAPVAVAAKTTPAARPACAAEVDALLDRDDPWAAKDALRTCDDPRAAGETAWMLGDFAEAAAAFARARERDPSAPVTVSEVEAAVLADPKAGASSVEAMKADWYRGPRDKSQDTLDCVTKELRSAGETSLLCLAGRHNVYRMSAFGLHTMPNYALHDPGRYFRFQPLAPGGAEQCGSSFAALDALAGRVCLAEIGVVHAIFAAVTGDAERLASELAAADALKDDLVALSERPPSDATEVIGLSAAEARTELSRELGEQTYRAQRYLAVAAAAAWVGHDDARARAYTPWVSAHERAILGEHLELVDGKRPAPDPAHSPSDYSDVDMKMFTIAQDGTPDELARELEARAFTQPVRLWALLAARPAHKAALRPWVERGFGKVCRTCGVYALLEASYRRREAARLVGARDLEARLAEVTRKVGRALTTSRASNAVVSIESLVDDAR